MTSEKIEETLDVRRDPHGRPYFHEAVPGGFDTLREQHPRWTIQTVIDTYASPEWCRYPDAVGGIMGCWSLIGGLVTGEDYCRSCDCHRDYKDPLDALSASPEKET